MKTSYCLILNSNEETNGSGDNCIEKMVLSLSSQQKGTHHAVQDCVEGNTRMCQETEGTKGNVHKRLVVASTQWKSKLEWSDSGPLAWTVTTGSAVQGLSGFSATWARIVTWRAKELVGNCSLHVIGSMSRNCLPAGKNSLSMINKTLSTKQGKSTGN